MVAGTTVHIGHWELTITSKLGEITNSNSGGVSQRKHTLREGRWRIQSPWDSEVIPDVDVTLREGTEIATLRFTLGDSGKFYSFAGIVEEMHIINSNTGDVVRWEASGFVNGTITLPVT